MSASYSSNISAREMGTTSKAARTRTSLFHQVCEGLLDYCKGRLGLFLQIHVLKTQCNCKGKEAAKHREKNHKTIPQQVSQISSTETGNGNCNAACCHGSSIDTFKPAFFALAFQGFKQQSLLGTGREGFTDAPAEETEGKERKSRIDRPQRKQTALSRQESKIRDFRLHRSASTPLGTSKTTAGSDHRASSRDT